MSCGHPAADVYLLVPCSELTDEDVRTAIKNSGGVKGSLLIPEAPFELLVRRAISRLLPSALQCQQFVHAELLRIASQCAPADVSRFPNLQVSSHIAVNTDCISLKKPVLCSVTYDHTLQCYLGKTIMTNHCCMDASAYGCAPGPRKTGEASCIASPIICSLQPQGFLPLQNIPMSQPKTWASGCQECASKACPILLSYGCISQPIHIPETRLCRCRCG